MQNNLNKNLTHKNNSAADSLINAVAKNLGCSPKELKAQLQSGELEKKIRSAAPGSQLSGAAALLNDPAAMQKLMSDPKAAELIRKLTKGR